MSRTVILIHGLCRFRWIYIPLERKLRANNFSVCYFRYSPRRDGVIRASEKLALELSRLSDEHIYFITHSMGALVLRALARQPVRRENLCRAVLIAPPNHGSLMMKKITSLPVPKVDTITSILYGRARQELLPENEGITETLPPPPCEFGIIAGGRNNNRGFSPLLPGDNDGTITVATTRMDGARDFIILPHLHTPILWAGDTIESAIRFLLKGSFQS
ncbi:alpha/beta hydrolase [Candidatus Sumerlaeota bacterium]|nr:alpha/beta hydrolase [Candidatus Sumerlaeota bacterium]